MVIFLKVQEGGTEITSTLTATIDGLQFEITTKVGRKVADGSFQFEPERKVTYSCEALGIKDVQPNGNRIKGAIEEIVNNIVSGKQSRGLLKRGEEQAARYTEEKKVLEESYGKEFPFKKELEEAKKRLAEYEELMKKELEAKEAKYAEMDAGLEAATDVAFEEEEDGESNRYRDGESEVERMRSIRELEPIEVERNEMTKSELREIYNNLPSVNKDGREIEFYRSAFKKIYKEGGLFGQIVPVLDEVLNNSVFAYSEPDNRGGQMRRDGSVHKYHPNVTSFSNYVGKVKIGNKEYYVRTTVENGVGQSGTHSFFVTDVKVYEKTAHSLSEPNFPSGESDYGGIIDAKLQNFFERASDAWKKDDMEARVGELSEKLNTPVRIVSEMKDIDKLSSVRERRSKGFYDPKTGEVVIVLPNNNDVADVENTFVHEVVGHEGLRALIGKERFDEFLNEVYGHSSDSIKRKIDAMTDRMVANEAERLVQEALKGKPLSEADPIRKAYEATARYKAERKREQFRREATEEYMSDMAGRIGDEGFEKMSREEQTLWGRIKARVQRFLDAFLRRLKIPKSIRLTDKDLAYILFKSWKNKRKGGGVFAKAEDVVMRRKTGWDLSMKVSLGDKTVSNVFVDGETSPKSRKDALEMLSKMTQPFENRDQDVEIYVSNRDARHTMQFRNADQIKAIGSIHKIIENAVKVGEEPVKEEEKATTKKIHIYYCPVNIDGVQYAGRMTVKEYYQGSRVVDELHLYNLMLKEHQPNTLSQEGTPHMRGDALSAYKVKELIGNWQERDQKFIEDKDAQIRFRDGDKGLEEYLTEMRVKAMQANADDLKAKRDAMRAIGGNLSHLRSAMARQKKYDISTVKSVTDLAKVLMENDLLDDLGRGATKRILSTINNVVGKQDVSKYVQNIMDIMIDNQLRQGREMFGDMLRIQGSRVDSRGIEVQGLLDADGVEVARVVKKTYSMPKEMIDEKIEEVLDRIGSEDATISDEASLEYVGLQISKQYAENITESKAEERNLRDSIEEAKQDYESGRMTKEAYRQYVAATEEAIRQNKVERVESFYSLCDQMGGILSESVERAKQWREAERARVREIQHNANSDMEGRVSDEHHKDSRAQKLLNNSFVRFLFAPLGTFDQILRVFGNKNVRGEGYLWNRYMRGWVSAVEKEFKGFQGAVAELDNKVSEVFGKKMKWSDLFALDRKLPKGTVRFWDGGEYKEHELTQGNMLYIYMANKMTDGKMKLRKMGITEEDVAEIENFVDPRFLELADWLQDEFLVAKRNEYNEVHKRMFGVSMAAIENYFPLKILANARTEEVDVAEDTVDVAMAGTSTGSIIKRRRNNLALDVTGANAISVILDHLQEMEHWAAYSEFNRDLNTLLSYKRFRNQVMNMNSVYGAGKTLWNNFRKVCAMAAGTYRPPIAMLDKVAVNIAKGVTAAKVSFRLFTAFKQFLSMPAYAPDAKIKYWVENMINPVKAWRWSMDNLPIFEKRWKSRMAGDPRLLKTEMDWKAWRSNIVQLASRIGMSPNAFVDAVTVAIGARSMYQGLKAKYLRMGMSEADAERRAKEDATILFNQTQQSSEGAFLSPMQVDRSWLSVLFTVFRNSAMAYTRQLYDASRNLSRAAFEKGYKEKSIRFMAKQYLRTLGIKEDNEKFENGWSEEDWNRAYDYAKKEYRRSLLRDLVRMVIFGFELQLAWNLGAYLPYLILGEDKEEKKKMLEDAWNHAMFGPIEGLTGGDAMSAALNQLTSGNMSLRGVAKDMPAVSDLEAIYEKFGKDNISAMNDVINLMVQSGIGANPQSLTDAVVAIMDYCGDDANTSRECALLIGRIMNCPQSQLDKIYFDELDATAREASEMSPSEIAKRYAAYKMRREAPLTGWMRSKESADSIKEKKVENVLNEAKKRVVGPTDSEAGISTPSLEADYKRLEAKQEEISSLKEEDEYRWRKESDSWKYSSDYQKYRVLKEYRSKVNKLTNRWLKSEGVTEKQAITNELIRIKRIISEMEKGDRWNLNEWHRQAG